MWRGADQWVCVLRTDAMKLCMACGEALPITAFVRAVPFEVDLYSECADGYWHKCKRCSGAEFWPWFTRMWEDAARKARGGDHA